MKQNYFFPFRGLAAPFWFRVAKTNGVKSKIVLLNASPWTMWLVRILPGFWLTAPVWSEGCCPISRLCGISGSPGGCCKRVSGVSGLLLHSPGGLWHSHLWPDAKTIPRFSFFCQARVITTSVSCLPCSISNYGCLLSVFQKSLPQPRERKWIMSAQL